ncbi:MAG TPA: hypothetical protein VGX27_03090 [Candidatus Dormibacteraeota bacterium]|nr:hypothetical protein [Candidatus Dormibacteraeota bacterium]
METEPLADDDPEDPSLESLLEALLVDDAEVAWDAVTGQPHVIRKTDSLQSSWRRRKSELDRPDGSA